MGLKKKGNIKVITLPDGDNITIRKVSQKSLGVASSQALLRNSHLLAISRQHAADASEALSAASQLTPRPPSMRPEENDRLMREVALATMPEIKRAAIRQGLVNPKFAELLTAYEGDESLPDFGLGDDFDFISDAILAWSSGEGGEAVDQKTAVAFPDGDSGSAGRDGGAIQQAAQ